MNAPLNTIKSKSKGNYFNNQKKTIFQYLKKRTATASMITAAIGISQKNICRYKRDLEKAGQLCEVKKDLCKITGFKAWYLTTNSKLVQNFRKGCNNVK